MTIRVLVVDDSAYVRKVISEILNSDPEIEVVGTAWDGEHALERVQELNPDVITLDLYMSQQSGVSFITEQMRRRPVPIVVCTSADKEDEQVVAAMEAGALDFVHKPTARASKDVYRIGQDLIEKVIGAAGVPPERIQSLFTRPAEDELEVPQQLRFRQKRASPVDAIVIGISTGGPQALRWLIPRLPADLPVAVGIVLHLPAGYTGPFSKRLNELSQMEVLEAQDGLEMKPGRVILAQSELHMVLNTINGRVITRLTEEPSDSLHRPSADELFRSAAEVYGSRLLGIVMTGMGSDGTIGASWIKAQGGQIFTESEDSCIVYGMPRSVVEAGLSDKIIPLSGIPAAILDSVWSKRNENSAN
jgi:two-component system chemotaxis response regulator CheB